MKNQKFDYNDSADCVNRGMFLIKNRENQMKAEGYEWPINTKSCRWAIEQKIINRKPGTTMMSAVIEFVEQIEREAEEFNGINIKG